MHALRIAHSAMSHCASCNPGPRGLNWTGATCNRERERLRRGVRRLAALSPSEPDMESKSRIFIMLPHPPHPGAGCPLTVLFNML
eukprot:365756-Chlamydomonas_euryale.AAC.23